MEATHAQGDWGGAEPYSALFYGPSIDGANTWWDIQLMEWDLQAGGSQVVQKISC